MISSYSEDAPHLAPSWRARGRIGLGVFDAGDESALPVETGSEESVRSWEKNFQTAHQLLEMVEKRMLLKNF